MNTLKLIFLVLSFSALTLSCNKEDELGDVNNIPGLGGDTWVPGPIDKWLNDNLTLPYNIATKYKWDQGELQADFDKTLTPPKEEKVIPLMTSIKTAWIGPYIAEAGILFFKQISPKFFILVGSPAFLRGAIKLGTAEGGRKVVLYDVNNFRIKGMPGYKLSDSTVVKRMFETIQHEFAHILDQNVKVPLSFRQSSSRSYTSDWLNVASIDAKNEGFISSYAISSADEDWAEMVALMLVGGKPWFDQYVNSITYTGTTANGTTSAEARARLRDKEAAVVSYFKQSWNIDFYSLQARTKAAINALLF